MARPTYRARAIVLKKTKLGETDLIVTLLASDGAQLRAVARGARKPGGAFAGKLELCNTVSLLCSQGASLDTITEARLDAARALSHDVVKAACASCIAELAERVTQPDLEHPRLFDLVQAALDALEQSEGAGELYVCAAAMLKMFALAGLMPTLDRCALCEGALVRDERERVPFSLADGGALCPTCAAATDAFPADGQVVALASSLLMATFARIAQTPADAGYAVRVLELCRDWCRFHVGARVRSLDFLLDMEVRA